LFSSEFEGSKSSKTSNSISAFKSLVNGNMLKSDSNSLNAVDEFQLAPPPKRPEDE